MGKLTINKVAQYLDVGITTIENWYKWYNDPRYEKPKSIPKLPQPEQAYPRATRYWEEADIVKLMRFRDWLPKGRGGVMGDFNAKFWGQRGRDIQARKQEAREERAKKRFIKKKKS